ncbi:MAG: DUF5110 domain-containing protein [Acidobacteria bacterium]|nr:DUF5110 domain-containing protein [Acidobacteriota bacterium]
MFQIRASALPIVFCSLAWAAPPECSSFRVEGSAVLLSCEGGRVVRLQAETPAMLRVRVSPNGEFPLPLTVRWGFVKDDWPAVRLTARDEGASIRIQTGELQVVADKQPFALRVLDAQGREIFRQLSDTGFSMQPDEHFYGLGFQRTALDVRGKKLQWWRAFRSGEATVPFFLSTRGYGFYSNNTFRHVFDFTGNDRYNVTTDGGQQDYYIFHGPSFKRILDLYTQLTGRPWLAPRWALGIGYQSRYLIEQDGVIQTARGFRREDIPIDWIGLEPGWEDVPYRMKWNWSPKRFPAPDAMIQTLAGMGIKMGLWESGDAPKTGYTDEAVRKEWYRPRIDAAISRGIKFFKQDDPYPRMISSQEMLEPELNKSLGGSGVFSAAEMNNLTNSLYSETAMKEYARVTGERTMIMFNGYNSSIASHRWPFTWEADFPLGTGALSASLSGHSLVSTRDRNEATDGIHVGYLAPFVYLESWAYYKEPWLYSDKLLDMNRYYAKLRYQLIPYLYASARQSVDAGLPVMRPMLLEFQNDRETLNLSSQFMIGDSLVVGSATAKLTSGAEQITPEKAKAETGGTPQIYLPKGRWYDFWSGQAVESTGQWRKVSWPKQAGGPLWVRGGAILPMGPVTQYEGQEPLEVVRLDVYPAGLSKATVYEDDGRTYRYKEGAFAKTEVTAEERRGGLRVAIGARQGSFEGMPVRRGYLVSVHTALTPTSVQAAGKRLAPAQSKDDLLYGSSAAGWTYEGGTLWIKPAPGWRYGYDTRGAGKDVDRDTPMWDAGATAEAKAVMLDIALVPTVEKKPVSGAPAEITLNAAHQLLVADSKSATEVTATVRDSAQRRVYAGSAEIRFEVQGPALLSCGAKNCEVTAADGQAKLELRATDGVGPIRVLASAAGLKASETAVTAVTGELRLQASPPERVKLNSDGAWLPLRITIYATVQSGGQRVKSATTKVRLHVTGGSGKVPEDLEAEAEDGIAVFPNIFFEKPPNYVVHVSGPGLKPAQIPVF